MDKKIITIGRQFGSGGREIGKKISEKLEINYYDKEILNAAAKESGLSEKFLNTYDEKRTNSILYSLAMGQQNMFFSSGGKNASVEQIAFQAQWDTILNIAGNESCVIIGRCADYILKDKKEVYKIFICADLEYRINVVSNRDNVLPEKAKETIHKIDKARAAYYNYQTDQNWGETLNYDLCINVSKNGIDETVNFIINFVNGNFS